MSEDNKLALSIEKIYMKDLFLEVPHGHGIFLERDALPVHVELQARHNRMNDDLHEAIVTVTLTAKVKDNVMFLVEVEQAGVFRIKNVAESEMGRS